MNRRSLLKGCLAAISCAILPLTKKKNDFTLTVNFDEEGFKNAFSAHIQTIKISKDFTREELYELGRKVPYMKYVSFPVNITPLTV